MATAVRVHRARRVSASAVWNGAIGLLVLAALVAQAVLNARTGTVPVPTRFIRMFSFFTVQSNILVGIAAFSLALAPGRDGRWWRVLRLDALVGISVTGVVYTTVLRTQHQLHGWAVVTDGVFHYLVPLAAVAGWRSGRGAGVTRGPPYGHWPGRSRGWLTPCCTATSPAGIPTRSSTSPGTGTAALRSTHSPSPPRSR